MSLRSFRERINILLYDSKNKVLSVLSFFHFFIVMASVGLLVYYYGFPLSGAEKSSTLRILELVFGFYILRFIIKIIYDYHPLKFLKANWFEAILMLWLLVEGIAHNFFGGPLLAPVLNRVGVKGYGDFSTIFIQLFMMILLAINIFKRRKFNPWFKIHPALLFTFSILTMTLIGAGLLMLPEMSTIEGGINFTDALFTSMSSVSVTGLTSIDISTALTFKGQIVVLSLIKVGGLNTIAFGALMLIMARFGVGVKHHEVVEDFVNKDSMLKANTMLFKIVVWATIIEVVGIALLFIGFGDQGVFADVNERLYQSIFHGISGFNNAGLSTLEGGMMHPDVINNYFVHTVIMTLFFLGGLGMIYIFDLFEIKKLRERMKSPWKGLEFGTKISLYFTIGLLLFGAAIFYIFEYNNTLHDKSFFGDLTTSLFQSLTTRNAGFNVVDTAALSTPVLITFLFLMFVGASSGSAGGGIRTSTFAIMSAALVSTIKGKKNTELFKRTIANDTVLKAYAIFLFFVIGNIVGPFILAISEADLLATGKYDFMDLVFEHVSAASTVGLSTGITAELSEVGKFVLIVAMFIGRVGTLTLAYLLGKQVLSKRYKYPEGHTMVG